MDGKALVILSGGQDSTTCLYWARERFKEVEAVTFDYGQRHSAEFHAAQTVAKMAAVQIKTLSFPGLLASSSPLVDKEAELEKYPDYVTMDKVIGSRIELTFVPMRNPFFIALAANHAVSRGIRTLVTGVCQQDNANYPDCRRNFVDAAQLMVNLALGVSDFEILTPLMYLSKAETVRMALGLPGCYEALGHTHTSYDGNYPPTDNNHANVLRAQGFLEAEVPDPLILRAWCEGLMQLPDTPNYKSEMVFRYCENAHLDFLAVTKREADAKREAEEKAKREAEADAERIRAEETARARQREMDDLRNTRFKTTRDGVSVWES